MEGITSVFRWFWRYRNFTIPIIIGILIYWYSAQIGLLLWAILELFIQNILGPLLLIMAVIAAISIALFGKPFPWVKKKKK